jgi:putative membrane protein
MAFINDTDRQRIRQAIESSEVQFDGELVAIIAAASDTYRYIPTMWAGLVTLLAPWLTLVVAPGLDLFTVLTVQSAVFLMVILLFHWRPVKMALVPRHVQQQRASRLAHEQFFCRGLHLTHNHNAVLLFVSVAERYVEIIADKGINECVGQECWPEIVAGFTGKIRAGRIAEGFLYAITECTGQMKKHYPPGKQSAKILPDHLIEI